jgi:sugar (pentulose or hexulose) kinase
MSVVLGVDIGTYEAKGVLVDEDGRVMWPSLIGPGAVA